jgi:GPH family glycoside/pentoside/hexuronide:cation symporter
MRDACAERLRPVQDPAMPPNSTPSAATAAGAGVASTSAPLDAVAPAAGISRTKILAWSIGTIGPVTLVNLVSYAYLFYMTDMLGVSAALAGALIFSIRIYDMFADPVMGYVSDRTRSRMGRRRPWMLAGALVSVGGAIAIFATPGVVLGAGSFGVAAWTFAALLVYFTGYTMFNVPYLAMPAEMTDGFQDRTRLMSMRVVFVSISTLLAAAIAPRLIDAFGSDRRSYELTAWIIGGISLAAMLTCVSATRSARATAATGEAPALLAQLRVAFSNRPFVVLIVTKLLLLLSMSSVTTTMFFFVRHVLKQDLTVASNIGLSQTIGMLAALPLWVRVARHFGKAQIFMVASGGNAVVMLSWLLASPGDPILQLMLRAAILGAFGGGALLMGQSMLPDTMEYDYRTSGMRREGAFAGIYSLVEKGGFAFGPLIVGGLLSATGYVGARAGGAPVVLSPETIFAVYCGVSIIPAVATALCVLVLRGYTLTEASLRAIEPPATPRP